MAHFFVERSILPHISSVIIGNFRRKRVGDLRLELGERARLSKDDCSLHYILGSLASSVN